MLFKINGLFIYAKKPEIADIAILSEWLASEAYCKNIGGTAGLPQAHYENQAFQLLQANANDESNKLCYLIFDRFTNKPVALSILSQIDWKNRHAEHSYIIGEEQYRAKLVAGDLNVVMNNYFFQELNLNKIYSFVFDFNEAALRLTAYGGQADGVLEKHRRYNGQPIDVHVYSITANEFKEFVRKHAKHILRKHLDYGLISNPEPA